METHGETIGYRPVSRLAVAAVVVGVAAGLAVTTPLLWILPLVGVAIAVAALADVAKPGAEKAGRAAALAGLALSVGFAAQAVTMPLVSRWVRESRTKAVALAWLDALRENRLADAASMMAPSLLPGFDPEKHDRGMPEPHHGHHHGDGTTPGIEALPTVKAILDCGGAAAVDVRAAASDDEMSKTWYARVKLEPCGNGGAVELRLEMQPTSSREVNRFVERWTIVNLSPGT
ncbi:MAG: hypothetical protein ACKOWG_14225 [Planctomycetia bacterium]